MIRSLTAVALLLGLFFTVGCGGVAEVKPAEEATPEVDQAEIDRQIQEGMKMGGGDYGKYGDSAPGAK